MDPALWEVVEGRPGDVVAALIRLRPGAAPPLGVQVVTRFGEVATCRLRRGDILRVHAHPSVMSLKAPRPLVPEPTTVIDVEPRARSGRRCPAGLGVTGRGVVIGAIDWGCDFTHPNLRRSDGRTRLLAIWDQREGQRGTLSEYGYGVVHGRREIDRALATDDPFGALDYDPADADPDGTGTHGTHVLDIAAGRPAAGPGGVAPGADLVFVHLGMLERAPHRIGNSVTLLEGVDFIARCAGERPWVVNLSLGSLGGPHDGSTLVEQALDAAVRERGGIVVHSVGNYYQRPIHTCGRLQPGARTRFAWIVDPTDETTNQLEVWYPGPDQLAVRLIGRDGSVLATALPGSHGPIVIDGDTVGRFAHRTHDPNNGDNHVMLTLDPAAGRGCRVEIEALHVVDGSYHVWIERDDALPGSQSRLPRDVAVRSSTTNSVCNGHLTISVGAYDDEADGPAFFSSSGPTRDGRAKPNILAKGVGVVAARSLPLEPADDALVVSKSGSSMAAPHVAGAAALVAEAAARRIGGEEMRRILTESARPVRGGSRAGAGCLDLAEAVRRARAVCTSTAAAPLAMLVEASGARWADSPAALFDAHFHGSLARAPIARHLEIVAMPGAAPRRALQPGDLLVHRALGEGDLATVVEVDARTPPHSRPRWDQLIVRRREARSRKRTGSIGTRARARTQPPRRTARAEAYWAEEDPGYLADPPLVSLLVNRFGLSAQAQPSVTFREGLDKHAQAASMLVRALVGAKSYSPALATEMVTKHALEPYGGLTGPAGKDEKIGSFDVLGAGLAVQVIRWLRNDKKLAVYLDDTLMRRLDQARAVEYAWTRVTDGAVSMGALTGHPDRGPMMSAGLSVDVTFYRWVSQSIFTSVAWDLGALVESLRAAIAKREGTTGLITVSIDRAVDDGVTKLWARFNEAADPIDAIRGDDALTADEMYRVLWQLQPLAAGGAGGPAVPDDTKPHFSIIVRFLEMCLARWADLAKRAKDSRKARKELLGKAKADLEVLLGTMQTGKPDDALRDAIAVANAPPFPCRLRSWPQLDEQTYAMPADSEIACEMLVEYGDVFDAFGAEYIWELLRLDNGSFRNVDGASLGTVLGRRLDRQMQYTRTDFFRLRSAIKEELGDPGFGALEITGALAIIRAIGTVISTFIQAIMEEPSEHTISLGGPGFYMIRCFSQQSSTDGPLLRVPSAAYLMVAVLPQDELASSYVTAEYDRLTSLAAELAELQTALDTGQVDAADVDDVKAAIAAYQIEVAGDVGTILEQQRTSLQAQIKDIGTRADYDVDPEKAKRAIQDRVDEIGVILGQRKAQLASVGDRPRFRILGVVVTDPGATVRLAAEAVHIATDTDGVRFRVVDSTTKNSGGAEGKGRTPAEAISTALLTLLEDSTTGYGRGTCSIIIPARPDLGIPAALKITFRVDANVGSILVETIEGATTIISVIAILAAPLTGGASLAILVPIGVIGIIPSAYRIATRVSRGTFRWDLDTAMEMVNIVGGLIGLAQTGTGALKLVRLAKGFMILGHGVDGLGIVLGNVQFLEQIDKLGDDTSMSPAQKRAALMGLVANKLMQDGILVGSTLGRRAQEEMQAHGLDPSRYPVDEGPALPPEAKVVPPDPVRTRIDPKLRAAEPELAAKARALVGRDVPVVRDPSLKGTSAEVRYRLDRLGFVDEVYIVLGARAGEAELPAHAQAAKEILKFTGIIGKARTLIDAARALLRSRPDLKVGSKAWEARIELEKLPKQLTEYLDAAPGRLKSGDLTPADIDKYIAGLKDQLAQHEATLHDASRGRGRVAVEDRSATDKLGTKMASVIEQVQDALGVGKEGVKIVEGPESQQHIQVKPKDAAGHYEIVVPRDLSTWEPEHVITDAQEHAALEKERPRDPAKDRAQEGPPGKRTIWSADNEAKYQGYPPAEEGYGWTFHDKELVYEGKSGQRRRAYDPTKGAFVPKETVDVFTTSASPPGPERFKFWAEPKNWTPERQKVQSDLLTPALTQAQHFADLLQKAGVDPTVYATRGNTAVGKGRATERTIPELKGAVSEMGAQKLDQFSLNPDNFKKGLVENTPGERPTTQDVHWESSALARRMQDALETLRTSDGKQPASVLVDKRLGALKDVLDLADMAQRTGRKFGLFDIDAPLEVSLAGVLERSPSDPGKPRPRYEAVASGFVQARSERKGIIDTFVNNPSLGSYDLYATRPDGEKALAASVKNGVPTIQDQALYDSAVADPVDVERAAASTVIDAKVIDALVAGLPSERAKQVRAAVEPYSGMTWKQAIDAHSTKASTKP